MNIMGTYSGITMDTVEQLISAESGKLTKFTREQTALKAEQTAWKDVQSRLTNLTDKMSALTTTGAFDSKKVKLSQEDKFTLTASPDAIAGDFSVKIKQLATRTQVIGNKLAEDTKMSSAWGKTGELTVGSVGKEAQTITITDTDSIESIIDRINEGTKESGVSAVIIDNHIVLQSSEYGDKEVAISGSLASDLGLGAVQTKKGQSASLTVNGLIEITRDSNEISDIMEGVTITLQAPTTEAVSVKITDDLEASTQLVQDFVDQYNSTMSFIKTQLDVGDPSQANNKTGSLAGDSSLVRLQSQLRGLLTQPVANDHKGKNTPSAIGITVDRYGVASLDKTKLETALKDNSKIVSDLFNYTVETTSEAADGKTVTKKDEVGMAQKFSTLLTSFTDSKEGIIATKNETYDKMIKDLDKRISVFNERLDAKRTRYIEQFTALDIAMMEAESQINYLMSQVNSTSSNNK